MSISQTNIPDWSALIPVLPDDAATSPGRPARWQRLYAKLRQLIESGALPPGAKLPPSRDLAARLGLARGAVVAAFELLVAEGFAEARTGAGTYVATRVPQRAAPAETPAATAMARPHPSRRDLPGILGAVAEDPRSLQIFRSILHRQLARPQAALFRYSDPQGSAELRREVAAYLQLARGVRCVPEQILITSGTQSALDLVLRSVLAPGDSIWHEDPGYPMARAAMLGAGLQVVSVPVDGEGLVVAAGIARAPRARAVYVTPSHQFPLGVTLSMPRRLALIDWAVATGSWIIEDDYDSEFRHAGPPLTALQGMDAAGRVIYSGSFSKAFMPGLRLGYLVLPEALLPPVLALRDRSDRYPPALAEGAMAEFLRAGHYAAHLRRARRRVRQARDALVAALAGGAAAGLARVTTPDQGLHLIAHLPPGSDDHALAEAAQVAGLGARALSPMYLQNPPQAGLVIGFSGFAPETLAAAARDWLQSTAR
ncbi:MocR-like pyridoxine biosynthesis transcription factor PdxR [Phaeovulum sp. W22_SRMD_FR3]|uniref:MocR-like pyridoxine biosynthesis transcription factor PdxR n=1 Tax=Phaeovulum sp. W22_SRMD_FR3 TaxID=3240274 RepID=UPI003F95409A